ncbi:MAG: PspC domain-containing protein, partial [Alistipes sp.]|nr:PspC domain-containing protein [Alistipes sp.]
MNEVKKCSISGVGFTLDAEAFEVLDNYLESLKKSYRENPDGDEIIADIEARIAELILSTQDTARVVERPLIENIVRQLGSAEEISDRDSDQDLRHETPRIPRRLYRDIENARLGGVCSGIGRYFDIDPVWVRMAIFAPLLLALFGQASRIIHWISPLTGNLFGIFVVCYVIMWFAVPAARTARQKLEMTGERITAQSLRAAESEPSASEPESKARPRDAQTE